MTFLHKDSSIWENKPSDITRVEITTNLKVLNNTTEYSIKLVIEYKLSKTKANKQYIL